MSFDANAIAYTLIFITVVVLVLLKIYGSRPSANQCCAAIAIPLIIWFATSILLAHACKGGHPDRIQAFTCFWSVSCLLFIAKTRWRIIALVILTLIGLKLASQFNQLVHGQYYTGNPEGAITLNKSQLDSLRDQHRDFLLQLEIPQYTNIYAGWLDEVYFEQIQKLNAAAIANYATQASIMQNHLEVSPLWHTSFTGLNRKQLTPVKLWINAGRWPEATQNLTWKVAPKK